MEVEMRRMRVYSFINNRKYFLAMTVYFSAAALIQRSSKIDARVVMALEGGAMANGDEGDAEGTELGVDALLVRHGHCARRLVEQHERGRVHKDARADQQLPLSRRERRTPLPWAVHRVQPAELAEQPRESDGLKRVDRGLLRAVLVKQRVDELLE